MKLLFDENLSRTLIDLLADQFPDCRHAVNEGLERANDAEVWEFARRNGCMIVSKDSDFNQLAFLHGPPPKAIWVRVGNCTTTKIANLLRTRYAEIQEFERDAAASVLVLD